MKHHNSFHHPPYSPTTQTNIHSYQTHIEISRSAINHNIAYYKQQIGHTNSLAVVIKGNGYGHGMVQIAQICQDNPLINWLCTANLSEAIQLTEYGITKPLLVLGYADIDPCYAIKKNIAFMIDNLSYAQKLNTIGKTYNYQIPVHIKIDTGLSRLGIPPDHAQNFINTVQQQLPYLTLDGIFSHFIASDTNKNLTNQQLNLLSDLAQSINTTTIPNIHMSNTMAISSLHYPDLYNFFRVGLGIYGFGNEMLQPALTWKTRIVSVKTVPKNSYISYACTYKTVRPTKVAIIPVGYHDGYQLRFSNKTSVLINSAYAPVIGRIGMNMTMIDITDCIAKPDDEVILIGTNDPIKASYCSSLGEISNMREFLTGIQHHIPRIII